MEESINTGTNSSIKKDLSNKEAGLIFNTVSK